MKNLYFKKKKERSAFTLIELLVVIAIMGILASIVLVGLIFSRNRVNVAVFKSAASSFAKAASAECNKGISGHLANIDIGDAKITYVAGSSVDCASDGSFSALLQPNPPVVGCTDATATLTGIDFTNCQ